MKTAILLLAVMILSAGCTTSPHNWTFHFEAEKGDMTGTVPLEPKPIEAFTHQLIRTSGDPLDSTATIVDATTKRLGTVGNRSIIEVRLQLRETYYTDMFLVLCETSRDRFLPIYAQQYHRNTRLPTVKGFSAGSDSAKFSVEVGYSGSDPTTTVDQVTVTMAPAQYPSVATIRQP